MRKVLLAVIAIAVFIASIEEQAKKLVDLIAPEKKVEPEEPSENLKNESQVIQN